MSELPGNAGVSVFGDKSLEFYRDPVKFCRHRIEKHRSRVFQCRVLNRPTAFICSVQGMRELLNGRSCSHFAPACTSVHAYTSGELHALIHRWKLNMGNQNTHKVINILKVKWNCQKFLGNWDGYNSVCVRLIWYVILSLNVISDITSHKRRVHSIHCCELVTFSTLLQDNESEMTKRKSPCLE